MVLAASFHLSSVFLLVAAFRFATACRKMYSICPFTLRSSSADHFSRSFHSSGGSRRRNGFLSAPAIRFRYKAYLYSQRELLRFRRKAPRAGYSPSLPCAPHPSSQLPSPKVPVTPCGPC